MSAERSTPPSPHSAPNWTINKPVQDLLAFQYRSLIRSGEALPPLAETGFRVFSQNDEDGILHFLFTVIGTADRVAVEICCGDGIECNSANLIVNHGWTALLVDGGKENIERGRNFYRTCRDTRIWPPMFVQEWVTAENINDLIAGNLVSGGVDLLSIDVDGMDWWLWKALSCIAPRVVVVEYQDILGPERSVTAPYAPGFQGEWVDGHINNGGASLAAFVKLGRQKGYRLVGTNRYGFNAFFVRNDLAPDLLPEVPVASCFGHPKVVEGLRVRQPLGLEYPWVEV